MNLQESAGSEYIHYIPMLVIIVNKKSIIEDRIKK